ncbi:MAG TPA: 30S ribosomal protein S6 [Caldilineae bacterium]|nr:30S ribosomal protein S6 [Caldilineae bacterium]HIQ11360.1 30S ribosomal protein S6 [Caldilineales bacterium]
MLTEYEMVTLFHPRLDEEGVEQVSQWLQDRIASLGGEDITVIPWGRRKLAYPIQKQLEATYIQIDFKLDGSRVAELTRAMRIHEDIMRQLVVRKQDL